MHVIPSLAASPVASQKASVVYGLLFLDERVYIGMAVTFDQIIAKCSVDFLGLTVTYALQAYTQITSCP